MKQVFGFCGDCGRDLRREEFRADVAVQRCVDCRKARTISVHYAGGYVAHDGETGAVSRGYKVPKARPCE